MPPLAIGYPASKLRTTAMIMNLCIFGAVALGPAIGGLQAQSDAWRPLFWIIAAIAACALLLAVLTFDDAPARRPRLAASTCWRSRWRPLGCAAAFFGASELLTHRFLDVETIVPLLAGLATIVVLIVYQFRAKRPLLTIRSMLTSTMPVAGIVVALFAAAASVSATALTAGVLAGRYRPLHLGLLYLPEVAGAVITAVLLGVVITRRAIHYLPLVGMVFLAAGIAVFRIDVPSSEAATLVGSGLTGIGLGATVAPALFVAGFSLPSASLQRVFAIVELMRAVAAFMIAPIFAHFAATVGGSLDAGTGHRAVDRPRARARRRRDRRRDLRARRRPPADARHRALRRRRGPRVVLAAAAREGSSGPGVRAARHRERQLRWRRATLAATASAPLSGPVLFAYDGSELAKLAIDQAGRQLAPGRDALVVCVWQTGDVGFLPADERHSTPPRPPRYGKPRRRPPRAGASLAEKAGFRAQSIAVEAAPTWKGIVGVAGEHEASLIVLGSHSRRGLARHLLGSVAAAVVAHSGASVLVVHS